MDGWLDGEMEIWRDGEMERWRDGYIYMYTRIDIFSLAFSIERESMYIKYITRDGNGKPFSLQQW